MGLVVRLRLEIADVPGALARAAAIIADHGGNITALDVQHANETSAAIDEVTIELGELTDLARLRRDLSESGVVKVVALQSANPEDLVVRVLRRLALTLAAPSTDSDMDLRRAVAELCSTPAVWVCGPVEAVDYEAGRQALASRGEAVLMQTSERMPAHAATVSGQAWLLAIAETGPVDSQRQRRVVFVARPLSQNFTTTEISRVQSLMALFDEIEYLRAARRIVPSVTLP